MSKRKPSDRHDQTIKKMAAEGAIMKEICDAIGESSPFVYQRLNRIGSPALKTKGQRLEQTIKDLAAAGLTISDISGQVGRSYGHVCRMASCAGIEIKRDTPDQPKKFDHELALAQYRDGVIASEIARHFGVSRERIRQITVRAGFKRTVVVTQEHS